MSEPAPFLSLAPGAVAPDRVWWTQTSDGVRVRAAIWHASDPVGHVVFLSGRTEYLEKSAIPAAAFAARGLSVVSLDWRGQGLSDRKAAPRLKGHIDDFAEFQRDLDAVLADDEVRDLPGMRLLAGHSMGGAISAAVMMRPELAASIHAAVLCAPMFGIAMNGAMRVAAWLTTRIGLALGKAQGWPPLGDSETPYVLTGFDDNLLTADRAVWDWMADTARDHPDLALGAPTLGWFAAAGRETRRLAAAGKSAFPVLMLVGSEEKVVDPDAARVAATRLGARYVDLAGGRHEGFVEAAPIRAAAWAEIDAFLTEAGFDLRQPPS